MDNPSPKTVLLQGEPGTGKSKMIVETAVHRPVYLMDIDRKIRSASWAQPYLQNGELVLWELREPFDETNLRARMTALIKDPRTAKPSVQPRGWIDWGEQYYKLPKLDEAMRCGTWGVDSTTILNEHFKSFIMYCAGRSKFTFDQWAALKSGWMDTFSVMRDIALENGKDLMLTVHERVKEEPGDRTTGVKTETVVVGDAATQTRTFVGTQDVKVWASIDGAFGDLIGAQTDEYYWLHVEVDSNKNSKWLCRVQPDGRRSLRTTFKVDKVEFEPDFRRIWK